MDKSIKATMFCAALMTGSSAWAGGIQIDPTGSGSISGSVFVTDPGSSIGDLLMSGMAEVGDSGALFAHNVMNVTGLAGELSFVLGRTAVGTSVVGSPTATGMADLGAAFDNSTSYFELYYNPVAGTADHTDGTGYDTGILLAAGNVSISTSGAGAFAFDTGIASGCLSGNSSPTAFDCTPTTAMFGSITFEVEFDDALINTDYVVNDLTVATIDMDSGPNGLSAPYSVPTTNPEHASSWVGGMGAAANGDAAWAAKGDTLVGSLGTDGTNNLVCFPGVPIAETCSAQMQMNTTLTFNAQRVPEPATLGLLGLGLGFAAWRKRKA